MKVDEFDPNAITFRPGDTFVFDEQILRTMQQFGQNTQGGVVIGTLYRQDPGRIVRHTCIVMRNGMIERWGACYLRTIQSSS